MMPARKAIAKKKAAVKKKATASAKKKVPAGFHRMPDGSLMKNSAMKKKKGY